MILTKASESAFSAFARKPGDGQGSVLEHADSRIDPPVDSGDGQLHELANREGARRFELHDLPLVEERAARLVPSGMMKSA